MRYDICVDVVSVIQVHVWTITEAAVISVGQQKPQEYVIVQWASFCRKTHKPATHVSVSLACIHMIIILQNIT